MTHQTSGILLKNIDFAGLMHKVSEILPENLDSASLIDPPQLTNYIFNQFSKALEHTQLKLIIITFPMKSRLSALDSLFGTYTV